MTGDTKKGAPWRALLATVVFMWCLGAGPAAAADTAERIVSAFLAAKGADFFVLPEERELFVRAVDALAEGGSQPAKRMQVISAMESLEDGNARIASRVLSDWYDRGDMAAPDAARQVAVVVGLGDIGNAHGAFRKAMKQEPGNPVNWFLLGHALSRSGKNDLAEMAFQQVQLLSNLSGESTYAARASARLGGLYLAQGKLERAEELLTGAIAGLSVSGPQSEVAIAYLSLGEIYAVRAHATLKQALGAFENAGWRRDVGAVGKQMQSLESAFPSLAGESAPAR